MTMTRKDFIRSIVGAGVGAMGVAALAGCGGDDGGGGGGTPDSPAAAMCTAPTAAIGANHGHTVAVTLADVTGGADKMYTLTGGGHTHTFTVTAAQFLEIKNGQTRMFTATGSGHDHSITVMCVS